MEKPGWRDKRREKARGKKKEKEKKRKEKKNGGKMITPDQSWGWLGSCNSIP